MAALSLYATLFEPNVKRIDLYELPTSHRDGPALLNVLRVLDLPQTLTLTLERSTVKLTENLPSSWEYTIAALKEMGWDEKRLTIEP